MRVLLLMNLILLGWLLKTKVSNLFCYLLPYKKRFQFLSAMAFITKKSKDNCKVMSACTYLKLGN